MKQKLGNTAQGKILDETVMSVAESNVGVHRNNVKMVGNLWRHRLRVCGTVGHNRDILKDLEEEV